MPGQALNRRFPLKAPRVVGRAWPDASRELQEFLDSLFDASSGIPAGFLNLNPQTVLVGGTVAPGAATDGWMSAGAQLVTAIPSVITGVGTISALGSSTTPSREDHQHKLTIPSALGGLIGSDGVNVVELPPPTFTKPGVMVGPTAPVDIVVWRAPWSCTLASFRAYQLAGGSVNVNARRNGTAEHLAADLNVPPAAWTTAGAVQNTTYVAGDSLEFRLKAPLVGLPIEVAFLLEFTRP